MVVLVGRGATNIGGEMLRCRWRLEPREDPAGQIGGRGRLHLLWLRRWQREPGELAAGQRLQTRIRRLRLLLLQWRRREPREASHGESLLLLRRGWEAGEVPDANRRMMMGVGHGQRRRRSRHFLLLLAVEQRALGHFLRVQITEEVGAHPTDCAKLREEG